MKTTDVFFKGSNFVGREIENVQDLVKAVEAGMDIADCDGNGYTSEYEDEDEDGCLVMHKKTKEELFNEMKLDLDNKRELYAGFFLDSGMYRIKPAAATTLQSDFYVGQEVYTMRDNKIVMGKVVFISLTSCSYKQDLLLDERARRLGETVFEIIASEINPRFTNYYSLGKRLMVEEEYKKVFKDNYALICVEVGGRMRFYACSFMEIFATKEELVKHLMEE